MARTVALTMAASVAVGVGLARARAERDRRLIRARNARERQFALRPAERPAHGLKRMALGQLDLAIEQLEGNGDGLLADDAVHETRKSLKRLRALIRLLEGELGEQGLRENAALREAGQRLAGTRDAEVLVGTLEGLVKRHPRQLAGRSGVAKLRKRLTRERNLGTERLLGDTAMRAEVIGQLRASRMRVAAWNLPDDAGFEMLEPGLRRLYRQGRRRWRLAARAKDDGALAMHQWRKRVKDLRYCAEMLDRREPAAPPGARSGPGRASDGRPAQGSGGASEIHRLARRADELGELLGEEHDLVLLYARVLIAGKAGADLGAGDLGEIGRGTRKRLLKLIARRRRRLRSKALREGERLYRSRPARFLARVRDDYAREARRPPRA